MRCPECGYQDRVPLVTDSRPYENGLGTGIRRRRECRSCGARWSTVEYATEPDVSVLQELTFELLEAQTAVNKAVSKLRAVLRGKDI